MPRAKDVWLPLLVVHASMMASTIMWGVIGYMASETMAPAEPMSHGLLLAITGAIAAICAALSFYVRGRLMPAREHAGDKMIDESKLATPAGRRALAKLRGALVASWALCEGVALCGLVGTFLFRDASDYAPFGAAALILLVVHAPKPQLLVDVLRAVPRS
jgi:hypothetical protein